MHGGERRVRLVGGELAERGECEIAVRDGAGDRLERADFRRRQPEPRQPRRTGAQDRGGIERIEGGREPSPDGVGARGRKLLRHDDGGKTGETILPPSQRRPSGFGDQRDKPRIGFAKRGKRGVEIGFGMDMGVHRACPVVRGHCAKFAPRAYLMD